MEIKRWDKNKYLQNILLLVLCFSKKYRRVWTSNETKAFLACYAARKNEFEHGRKKKFAMQNVLEDLIAQNVLVSAVKFLKLFIQCAFFHLVRTGNYWLLTNKLKNLMRAYKSAKDGNKKTGSAPIQVPFQEILDEIFGSQPNISNEIVLNLRGKATQSLQLRNTPPSYRAEFSVSPPPLDLPPSPTLESSPSASPSQSRFVSAKYTEPDGPNTNFFFSS